MKTPFNGADLPFEQGIDLDYFHNLVHDLYDSSLTPFTEEEVLEVFDFYFSDYRVFRGRDHPRLGRENILKIIRKMHKDDFGNTYTVEDYVDGQSFKPRMIDKYFKTEFPNCDYNINHFFYGRIRSYRYQECLRDKEKEHG